MNEMILTYVLESEHLTYDEALALAEKRDEQAAEAFEQSVPDKILLTPTELLKQMVKEGIRQIHYTFTAPDTEHRVIDYGPECSPLDLPLDPRKTWGKI